MSQTDPKFLKPLAAFTPVNAPVATGDTIPAAIAKLQGQLDGFENIFVQSAQPSAVKTTSLWFQSGNYSDPTLYDLFLITP